MIVRQPLDLTGNTGKMDIVATVTGGGVYDEGDTAILIATANTGYRFVSWSNGEVTESITVVVTGDATYTATFEAIPTYTVTVVANDATMGSVTGGGQVMEGTTVQLSATANSGYHFDHWSNNETTPIISVVVMSDTTFTAFFEENDSTQTYYTVTAEVNDTAMGHVLGAGEYVEGATVTLVAVPHTGYRFVSWSNNETTATITFVATSDVTLTATFEAIPTYTVTVNYDATMGQVNGIPEGEVLEGTSVTLTAVPNDGFRFVSWNTGETTPAITFVVTEDVTYTATFEAIPVTYYTLTVNTNNASMGHVDGAPEGPVAAGTQVTLTAVANEGYKLVNWSTGETTATITVTVNSDMTVTANFAVGIDDVNAANVSLYPNPATSTVTLTGIEGTAEVTIVDMNGRAAGKWTVVNGELTIDVTTLAQGAYFVRIVGEQVNAIRKLIVR